ncbi:MAG: hypothetical protein H7308_09055 [Chthonomonadaceae bacterium]|nr:hypothetical protein [Chthonomonadaceae bacterium]
MADNVTETAERKTTLQETKAEGNDAGSCQHCGALVYNNTLRCSQCGKFPVRIHLCPKCKSISAVEAIQCWKCGKPLELDGDFL